MTPSEYLRQLDAIKMMSGDEYDRQNVVLRSLLPEIADVIERAEQRLSAKDEVRRLQAKIEAMR